MEAGNLRVINVTVILLLLFTTFSLAGINRVPSDYTTIQAATDASVDGDTVLVAPGTYTGDGNRDIDFKGKAITVKSEEGPQTCIIDCQGSEDEQHRGFYFHSGEDANSVVIGFTITKGYTSSSGGGIYCEASSPCIENCNILNNTTTHSGGAIYSVETYRQPGPEIINCKISYNRASNGGAIYCFRSEVKVSNSILNGNIASDSGGAISCHQSAPFFTNCTIVNNHADRFGGAFNGEGASSWSNNSIVTFENCIIWSNSASVGNAIARVKCSYHTGCPAVKITHCCLPIDTRSLAPEASYGWHIDLEKSVFSLDPRFVDPNNGDFRLHTDSPCIDAGTNTPTQIPPLIDINGNSRIIDSDCDGEAIIDLGANETIVPDKASLRPSAWNCEFVAYEDARMPEPQQVIIKKVGTGAISWQAVSDCQWLKIFPENGYITNEVSNVTLRVDASGLSTGIYTGDVVFRDPNLHGPKTYISVFLNIAETFVVPEQFPTIQAAIDSVTIPGTHIILKDGTYKGTGNRDITFRGIAVSLFSENGSTNCVIDCEGSETETHQAFSFQQIEDHRTIIEGITITNSGGKYRSAINCEYGSPIIRNCQIINSISDAISCGAGTYPLIEDCLIEGGVSCRTGNLSLRRCDINGRIKCQYGHLSIEQSSVVEQHKAPLDLDYSDCTITASTINGTIYLDECGRFDVKDSTLCKGGPNVNGDAKYINIQNCLICNGNVAGVMISGEQIYISDCTVCYNKGIGIISSGIDNPILEKEKDYIASIRNCLITENGHGPNLGGVLLSKCDVTIENCRIIANTGPGIRLDDCNSSMIHNSIICGNRTELRGAGIRSGGGHTIIQSCTIASNLSMYEGGAVHGSLSDELTHIELLNCILWDNGLKPIILWDESVADSNYSNIQNGWPGESNINVDPMFVEPGYWDPNGTPDDHNDDFWVDGDYHLKSQAGRWDPVSGRWVVDDVTSPCIDAGDPNSPVGDEPEPNGGRINMGAYGGTAEASKSGSMWWFETTQGAIAAEGIGVILPHEHIFTDLRGPGTRGYGEADAADVIRVMVPLLEEAKQKGVGLLFECSSIGVGRNISILSEVSKVSGLPVVVPTGVYGRANFAPVEHKNMSEDELTELFISEIREGIEGTDIKAGFIKIATGGSVMNSLEEKILRAAGRAALETGAAVASHTTVGTNAIKQADVLESISRDIRFIWVHAQSTNNRDLYKQLAERGVFIEFDSLGWNPGQDSIFIASIKDLLAAGYGDKILLSHDAGWYQPGERNGGTQMPYTYLVETFIPKLRDSGIDDETIRMITEINPIRAFGFNQDVKP